MRKNIKNLYGNECSHSVTSHHKKYLFLRIKRLDDIT